MPIIKPVSDLRNYNEVLREVTDEQPVFLTRNGRGSYAIISLDEYDRMQATFSLISELGRGEQSAKESGWLSADSVEKTLGV